MRAREFLRENENTPDPLLPLKQVIIDKVKLLPADDATKKSLEEIEDLLSHVGAGGKIGYINNSLEEINDPDVNKARKLLAKYILSINMSQLERNSLFSKWKSDTLINRSALLTPGKNTIKNIIPDYGVNKGLTELVDDLSQVAALGQGKGEFLLSVLSKNITKLQKGDLSVDGQKIEVKTQDVGSGRFYDQEVRPAAGYQQSVENFTNTWKSEISYAFPSAARSGLKLVELIELADHIEPTKKNNYFKSVEAILKNIFPNSDISNIMDGIQNNNIGFAKQSYAIVNLNYYASKKADDGMLFINMATKPMSFVFFKDATDLTLGGMRLHAGTVYPVTNDPRNAYPQISIVSTKSAIDSPEQSRAIPNPVPQQPKQPVVNPPVSQKPVVQQPIQQRQI